MPPDPIPLLQHTLRKHADEATKRWFDNYLKGAIAYIGLKTPLIQKLLKQWVLDNHLNALEITTQLKIVKRLLALPYAEEKFSGLLYLQLYLINHTPLKTLVTEYEHYFKNNYFNDWSSADWMTVRAIAPLFKKDADRMIELTSAWSQATSLWQRRASIVALRPLVKETKYLPIIARTIETLLPDERRFIQTGIGWTLSDLSKHHPKEAAALVEKHLPQLSPEVLTRHTKNLPKHQQYKQKK